MPEHEHAIKSDVGFVSEDMAPYGGKSIAWNLDLVRSLSPRWDAELATSLLRRFDLRPGQRVLDIACGNGLTSRKLAASGAQVTAFDISARMIELADRVEVLQVRALCWCGKRATHNARTGNGIMVVEGEVIVVGDVDHERIAVTEANKLGIPVIGVCDSNSDPEGIDYLIPIGGDDTLSYGVHLAKNGFKVVAIPKTMDNDVPGTDYCLSLIHISEHTRPY